MQAGVGAERTSAGNQEQIVIIPFLFLTLALQCVNGFIIGLYILWVLKLCLWSVTFSGVLVLEPLWPLVTVDFERKMSHFRNTRKREAGSSKRHSFEIYADE